MAQTLSNLCGQVAQYLDDAGGARYSEGVRTAGVRLALGEYNLLQAALGQPAAALAGLDGALETSLADQHESLLVEGAAGYAAALREAGRGEICGLGRPDLELMAAWSSRRLAAFRQMLEEVQQELERQRLAGLRSASTGTTSPVGWPVDEWDGQP